MTFGPVTSSDVNYVGKNPDDVSVTNVDNETASITVSALSGNTTEMGGTATFTVVLDSQPTSDVSIAVSSSDTSYDFSIFPDLRKLQLKHLTNRYCHRCR